MKYHFRLISTYFLIVLFCYQPHVESADPRDEANLKSGQLYETAKSKLLKIGFKIVPTNFELLNARVDKDFSEIKCGRIKNEYVDKKICVVRFEKENGDFINLEVKKTKSGKYILDEL